MYLGPSTYRPRMIRNYRNWSTQQLLKFKKGMELKISCWEQTGEQTGFGQPITNEKAKEYRMKIERVDIVLVEREVES